MKENSEFETHGELQADYREKLSEMKIDQGTAARRNNLAEAVAGLVDDDDLPEAMVSLEVENRMQEMSQQLQAQGLNFEQYLQFSGQSQEDFFGQLRSSATVSAKVDLALRSIAQSESISVDDEELAGEFAKIGDQINKPGDEVRADFEQAGQVPTISSDILKTKTLDWLVDRVKMVDADGNEVDPEDLKLLEAPDEAVAEEKLEEDPQPEAQTVEDTAE